MPDKGAMTATFDLTPRVRKVLEGKPREYIVANPVIVEAEFDDGRKVRYPQNIRERVVRCRDCGWSCVCGDETRCSYFHFYEVDPNGFCAWGKGRED